MDEHTTNARDEDRQVFRQVRSDIQAGELSWAEELLDGMEDRCAEWHFLKGQIYYRKGWMDEAQQHYEAACEMEPENEEYREAAERMREGMRYSPEGILEGTLSSTLPVLVACGSLCVGGFCVRQCCFCGCDCCFKSCCIPCNECSDFCNRCG
nr:tetratricopeptide repeat protein [uncultured Oscillibacter sp.]